MELYTKIAFKEWSAICKALRDGGQSILIRKGGIDEGVEGFRVLHREFWLFPTGWHQGTPGELTPLGEKIREEAMQVEVPAGIVSIDTFVRVERVLYLDNESDLENLKGLHCWSEETVHKRFHYRTRGLFVIALRAFRTPAQPYQIPLDPDYAGCKSWVTLKESLPFMGLIPVLTEELHRQYLHSFDQRFAECGR